MICLDYAHWYVKCVPINIFVNLNVLSFNRSIFHLGAAYSNKQKLEEILHDFAIIL